jgi:hypothetical protein
MPIAFSQAPEGRLSIDKTHKTRFPDIHKPLQLWVEAMWHGANQKNGASALAI